MNVPKNSLGSLVKSTDFSSTRRDSDCVFQKHLLEHENSWMFVEGRLTRGLALHLWALGWASADVPYD